jgi:hypothetical protein
MITPRMKMVAAGIVATCIWSHGTAAADTPSTAAALALESLPEPAQRAIREQGKDATITAIHAEDEDGQPVYDVRMDAGGLFRALAIAADGRVLIAEEELAAASIPAPVKATLDQAAGDGSHIVRVKSVSESGVLVFYEAELQDGSDIAVQPDGQLRSGHALRSERRDDADHEDDNSDDGRDDDGDGNR